MHFKVNHRREDSCLVTLLKSADHEYYAGSFILQPMPACCGSFLLHHFTGFDARASKASAEELYDAMDDLMDWRMSNDAFNKKHVLRTYNTYGKPNDDRCNVREMIPGLSMRVLGYMVDRKTGRNCRSLYNYGMNSRLWECTTPDEGAYNVNSGNDLHALQLIRWDKSERGTY